MAEKWIAQPNLPEGRVTLAAVAQTAATVRKALQQRDIQVLQVPPSHALAAPVAAHADMLLLPVRSGILFCGSRAVESWVAKLVPSVIRTYVRIQSPYPSECGLNVACVGKWIFANPKCLDTRMLAYLQTIGVLVAVRQGYTKCNVAVVTEHAIMTEDSGIAKAAAHVGLDVLQLEPGAVRLPGYPYGFLGGACGKLSASELAFTGSLDKHPQAEQIRLFLQRHGVRPVELCAGALLDIGGIVPLQELACVIDEKDV